MKLFHQLRERFSRNLAFSWIVSYLVIVLVPLASNIYIYARAESALKQNIYTTDRQMLEASGHAFEKTLLGSSAIVRGVENSRYTSQLLREPSDTAAYANNCIQLARLLESMRIPNENILDMYVYLRGSDTCVSTRRIDNADSFFADLYATDESLTQEAWRRQLDGFRYAACLASQTPEGIPCIDLYYSLPMFMEHTDGCVVVRLDSKTFFADSESYVNIQDKNLYVLDAEGNVILRQETTPAQADLSVPFQDGIYVDRQGNLTVSWTSDVNHWQYAAVTSRNAIRDQLAYIRTPIILIFILSLCLVALLIVYFTYRNYRPLVNILSAVKNTIQGKPANEYDMISNIVDEYLQDKRQLRHIEHTQRTAERAQLLRNLTKGNLKPYRSLKEELAAHKITFISDYFSVMLINVIHAENLFSADESTGEESYDSADNQEQADTILFIITNVLEELLGKYHRGYVVESDGWIVCIANINPERLFCWYEDVEAVANEANSFIQANFQFSFTSSLSGIHEGIESLPTALFEATKIMSYRSLLKNDGLMVYEDINQKVNTRYFTEEHERKLLNFVRLGNESLAAEVVDEILDQLKDTANIDQLHILVFQMASSMLKCIVDSSDADDETDYSAFLQCLDSLMNYRSMDSYHQQLHRLLHIACGIVAQRKALSRVGRVRADTRNTNELVKDIKQFIYIHHQEPTLNIASVGEHFSITPYYLSNIFKKAEGLSLLDYIAKQRIESSKKLLTQGDLPLSSIAEQVGFSNVRSFMRTFRKFEGGTPGQYKEQHT